MAQDGALRFSPNDMTVGDLEDFQEITGVDFEELLDDEGNMVMPKGATPKVLKAIVFISRRKDNPAFTLDDARAVRVTDIQMGGEDDENPLDEPSASAASNKEPPSVTSGV